MDDKGLTISKPDQQLLLNLQAKYSSQVILDFINTHQPRDVVEVKDYSLGRVNNKLAKLTDAHSCRKLVIKFRGHDAGVLSFFGEENLKRYMQSYGDYNIPKEFVEFPEILAQSEIIRSAKEILIYFPFTLFEHGIFESWNKVLRDWDKTTIIAQKLESRKNFEAKIVVRQENWRYESS